MIEKLKQLSELLSDLFVEGVIGCSLFNPNEFQMSEKRFFEIFSDFEMESTHDNDYPFKAFVVIDGLKIFTILSQEKYEKYVLKEVV